MQIEIQTRKQAIDKFPFLADLPSHTISLLLAEIIKFMITNDAAIMEALTVMKKDREDAR